MNVDVSVKTSYMWKILCLESYIHVNLMEKNIFQMNIDVSVKKHHICEKDYVWNPATCKCENEINLVSIIDDSTIICDEIINVKERNFNEKNVTCKTKKFYILLDFLLITLALLMVVSIFCYLIKYQFHSTNNKLNKW